MSKFLAYASTAALIALAQPALADPSHCPPGHAMKGWCSAGEPSNMGRAQGDTDVEIDSDLIIIRDLDRFRLPPLAEGERYAIVGDRVVRVSAEEYATIAVVGALSELLVE
ncbi:hypothetical protein [Pontivivens insulae]|uniref:Uncharacterized protein n=1 Tax=Pontivivens insulae TaxID=1639689 RepID=A0A2R8ADE1_9RHOB|nr:hypothetical protein [Pontivivens insulae]RED14118.1 hypothetical protein DFR53_1472 [Pontivivens insulae]SPF30192.1 hypothetical protein POI8812_02527 [Pontivivens insulae]